MPNSKGKHIDFIVTTSDPNDASSSADNKRRVRSVAALKSWPGRRKRFFDQLEPTGGSQSTFLVERPESPPPPPSKPTTTTKAADINLPKKRKGETRADSATTSYVVGNADRPANFDVLESAGDQAPGEDSFRAFTFVEAPYPRKSLEQAHPVAAREQRKRTLDGSIKADQQQRSTEVALPTPPYSPRSSPSSGCADPFNCYPVEYKPWFDRILHHMLTIYAPRGWPALKITNQEGVNWERFMTQNALAEPALFYVRLYFGSGDLLHLGAIRPEAMYWLRLQAIRSINDALSDPARATSDALILAVGRIALSECLYGDRHAASTIHRPAQKRMIDLRGGMKALDFPQLVKRLMRWSDSVMAMRTNTTRLLEDDEQNKNFTQEQSIGVLEKWAPREGLSLRQKISPADSTPVDNDT